VLPVRPRKQGWPALGCGAGRQPFEQQPAALALLVAKYLGRIATAAGSLEQMAQDGVSLAAISNPPYLANLRRLDLTQDHSFLEQSPRLLLALFARGGQVAARHQAAHQHVGQVAGSRQMLGLAEQALAAIGAVGQQTECQDQPGLSLGAACRGKGS